MAIRHSFASVLVVGAGPAGATAARTLALAGVPVRLLDRSAFPRNKPCGGGLSLRVVRRFPYLQRALERIPTLPVARLRLDGPDGASALITSPVPAALMVRRVEFDALLVSLAVEAGAELLTGIEIVQAGMDEHGVRVSARDGRQFAAPVVIAADGVHSVIARRLGLNRGWAAERVALDLMEETPRTALTDVDPATLWVSYGHDLEGGPRGRAAAEGYAYVFPKPDHVNVGVGYLLSYYRRHIRARPYDLQRDLVGRLRRDGLLQGESVRRHFTPYLIPVAGPLRRPGRGRVLLAGDAGGFVNAFTAEGIYYAMVSGDLAARAVIETPDPPRGLVRRFRRSAAREIGRELRDAVLIQRYLFADRARIARVLRNASRFPETTRAVLDYAAGERSYASVRRHLLSRFPALALRVIWDTVGARAARLSA